MKYIPTEEETSLIIETYKQIGTYKGTAEKLGYTANFVKNCIPEDLRKVRNYKITANGRNKKEELTEELKQKINEEYMECLNKSEVSRRLNIPLTWINESLTEENQNKNNQQVEDFSALWFYVYKLFGEVSEATPISGWNITQMKKFHAQGMSYRAQLLTLQYFYEVRHNSIERSHGSIGIIPYVFEESKQYYLNIGKKQQQITEEIKKQLEKDRKTIAYDPTQYMGGARKKKKIIDLSQIESGTDDSN